MIDIIRKIHRILKVVEDILMIAPLVIVLILVTVQVIARYVFLTGIMWSDELVGFSMVLIGMVGSAIAVREKAHTDLTVFLDKAPKPLGFVMKAIINITIIGFLVLLIISGIQYAENSVTQTAVMMRIPMVIPYSLVPIGAFLMLVEFILLKLKISESADSIGSAERFL